MPGLERETEMLDASKRNSSQTNCTVDSVFPPTPLNIEGVPNQDLGNLNTSVIGTQEANKGKILIFKSRTSITTLYILMLF